jgi:hypothetical protein
MRFEAEMLCLKSLDKLFNFTLKLNMRALEDPPQGYSPAPLFQFYFQIECSVYLLRTEG